MQALPSIRPPRTAPAVVPAVNTSSSTGPTATQTRTVPQLIPLVQQRPSKPLTVKSAGGEASGMLSTARRQPVLVYLPRPKPDGPTTTSAVPVPPLPHTPTPSLSSSSAVSKAPHTPGHAQLSTTAPASSLAEVSASAVEALTVLCTELLSVLSPATENVLRLGNPLRALLDDLKTVRRARESQGARAPCVARVAVTGALSADRQSVLAFLWYDSAESTESERDLLLDQSLAGAEASFASNAASPYVTVKTRRTRRASLRSSGTGRTPTAVVPFPAVFMAASSTSLRAPSPHTPPPPTAGFSYDQRLLCSPTEGSTGAYPSSCESSQMYAGVLPGDRDGASWLPVSPQMEIVQLFTPPSPPRSPMGSSLQLPSAPQNPRVRPSHSPSRQVAGRKEELTRMASTLSSHIGMLSPPHRPIDSAGTSSLVQRFTAGLTQFTHHQRVLSSDTEGSTRSPPLGPTSHPLVSDQGPIGTPPGSGSGVYPAVFSTRGQSLVFSSSGGSQGAMATDSEGGAWAGLLDVPRPRADTLPAVPGHQGYVPGTAVPLSCTSHLLPNGRATNGAGSARGSGSSVNDAGLVRQTGGARGWPRRKTICVQAGTFDLSPADLVRQLETFKDAPNTDMDGETQDGGPARRRSVSPPLLSTTATRGMVSEVPQALAQRAPPPVKGVVAGGGGGGSRGQRASNVHVTPPSVLPMAWLLSEEERGVMYTGSSHLPTGEKPWNSTTSAPVAPTKFTGDAFFLCLSCSDMGESALRTVLEPLFGTAFNDSAPTPPLPDAALLPPPPTQAVLIPAPPSSRSNHKSASEAQPPTGSGAFHRQVVPAGVSSAAALSSPPAAAGKARGVNGSGSTRAVRQLIASQIYFILTGFKDDALGSATPSLPQSVAAAAATNAHTTTSRGELVDSFRTQMQTLYGVTVEPWQVIPFNAELGIAARDFLVAYYAKSSRRAITPLRVSLTDSPVPRTVRPSSSMASVSPPRSARGASPHYTGSATVSSPRTRKASVPEDCESVEANTTSTSVSTVSPAAMSPVVALSASPVPSVLGRSILKKRQASATDGISTPPHSSHIRVPSFHGMPWDDEDVSDATSGAEDGNRAGTGGDSEGNHELPLSSWSAPGAVTSFTTSPRPTGVYPPWSGGNCAPPLLSTSPTTIFSSSGAELSAGGNGSCVPPWRLAPPLLSNAVSGLCNVVPLPETELQTDSTANKSPRCEDTHVQRLLRRVTTDIWFSSGAAQLSTVAKHFEKVSASHFLSHVAVSLRMWSDQIEAALPEAIASAELYRVKLQTRLSTHAQRRQALAATIDHHETHLCPATTVRSMRAALETAFLDVTQSFARDVRVMLVLREAPREICGPGNSSTTALDAAVARLREQARSFHEFYHNQGWEQKRAELVNTMRTLRSQLQRDTRAPASAPLDGSAKRASVPPTEAATARVEVESLAKACQALDTQLIARLSQLNTEIINTFLQYCVARLETFKDVSRREMKAVQTTYESLLAQLAALPGAKHYVPLSSTRSALRGWRQQLSLLATPPRSRVEPFVFALRAALCEDQVRALARVHRLCGRTRRGTAAAAAATSGLVRAASHGVVPPKRAPLTKPTSAPHSQPKPARTTSPASSLSSAPVAPTPPPMSLEACLADTAGGYTGVGKRSRRLVWRTRYAGPGASRGTEGSRDDDDAHALALEFSLFGAQSLRRGQTSLSASLRGVAPYMSPRDHRRGSSALSAVPPTFLAKVSGTSPLASAASLEASVGAASAQLDARETPSPQSPVPSPTTTSAAEFPSSLATWRLQVPAELRTTGQFTDEPLLQLILETWDELLLATPMYAWIQYFEADYIDAVNSVGTDLLSAQKAWLARLASTDEKIKEHIGQVDVEVARLKSASEAKSISATVAKVREESQTIGDALAAARREMWTCAITAAEDVRTE